MVQQLFYSYSEEYQETGKGNFGEMIKNREI